MKDSNLPAPISPKNAVHPAYALKDEFRSKNLPDHEMTS